MKTNYDKYFDNGVNCFQYFASQFTLMLFFTFYFIGMLIFSKCQKSISNFFNAILRTQTTLSPENVSPKTHRKSSLLPSSMHKPRHNLEYLIRTPKSRDVPETPPPPTQPLTSHSCFDFLSGFIYIFRMFGIHSLYIYSAKSSRNAGHIKNAFKKPLLVKRWVFMF